MVGVALLTVKVPKLTQRACCSDPDWPCMKLQLQQLLASVQKNNPMQSPVSSFIKYFHGLGAECVLEHVTGQCSCRYAVCQALKMGHTHWRHQGCLKDQSCCSLGAEAARMLILVHPHLSKSTLSAQHFKQTWTKATQKRLCYPVCDASGNVLQFDHVRIAVYNCDYDELREAPTT